MSRPSDQLDEFVESLNTGTSTPSAADEEELQGLLDAARLVHDVAEREWPEVDFGRGWPRACRPGCVQSRKSAPATGRGRSSRGRMSLPPSCRTTSSGQSCRVDRGIRRNAAGGGHRGDPGSRRAAGGDIGWAALRQPTVESCRATHCSAIDLRHGSGSPAGLRRRLGQNVSQTQTRLKCDGHAALGWQ